MFFWYTLPMKYKKIPHTDLEVSEICLGTMTFGRQNTEEEAHAQLDYAMTQGINFIDTAELYPVPPELELQGLTETYIGNWLAKRGNRKDLIIATKVAAVDLIRTRTVEGKPRLDKKSIREAIEGSLARLQTDYIDLYQIHWPERKTNFFGIRAYPYSTEDDATDIEETLTTLTELIAEGKVRYIGVSNETAWGVSEYLRLSREKGLARIVRIQNQYSLLNRTFEIGLSEFCAHEGIGLLPYSVLSMGVLAGKYLDGQKPEGARFTISERNSSRYNAPEAQDAIRAYVELAHKHNIDPSVMAIAFANMQPFTTSTIIGATTLEQLKTDIGACDVVLSDELLKDIDELYKKIPDPAV
jgi:aryl-alcohol dehydrogenase-like predicted oxidoreductase